MPRLDWRLDLRGGARRLRNLATASVLCSLAAWLVAPTATQNCAADGETRTLHLYHTHTQETIDATFRVDGHYDPTVLRQLNHFLRDWRNDDEIGMDPRLFDAIWEAYRSAGANDRIQIYSAYRSPETNAMLRRRSRAVAEHLAAHARQGDGHVDARHVPDVEQVREIGDAAAAWRRRLLSDQRVPPSCTSTWAPSVPGRACPMNSWPELFPDGKTVHIASNGQTLPGYEQARLELAQRGQTDLPPAQESGGFFAWLFGGGSGAGAAHEDEEDRRVAVASAAPPPAPAVQQVQAQAEPVEAPVPQPVQQAQAAQPEALPRPRSPTPRNHSRSSRSTAAPRSIPAAPSPAKTG